MQQQDFGMSRQPHDHVATQPVNAADVQATSPDTALTNRQRFSLTIQGVGSLLNSKGIERDSRTLQRWCSSGKVDAIIDTTNGERWLIDPATVQPVIDDLISEMERRPAAINPTPGDASRDDATIPGTAHSEPAIESGTRRDDAERFADTAAMSSGANAEVATIKKELEQVKFENLQLKADVKSRESFNEYIKGQFESVLDQTLDRAERIGQLEAEVAYLQAALPKGESELEKDETEEPGNPQTYKPGSHVLG